MDILLDLIGWNRTGDEIGTPWNEDWSRKVVEMDLVKVVAMVAIDDLIIGYEGISDWFVVIYSDRNLSIVTRNKDRVWKV